MVFFNQVPYMQISDMILGVNIISGKVNIASVNGAGGSGGILRPIGSKEHPDWLKIDFNAAEIIQDYNKKKCEWKYTYTVLKLRVKQVIYESNI